MQTAAAIFDFDGTLVPRNIWMHIVRYHLKQRKRILFLIRFFLVTNVVLALLVRLHLYDPRRLPVRWMEGFTRIWRGYTPDETNCILSAITEAEVIPYLRSIVVQRLREHRLKGQPTFLVSGFWQPLLELVGKRIGVDYVIGTPLEYSKGRCTGKVTPPLLMGQVKVDKIKQFVSSSGLDIDLSLSYAYADSIRDLSLLELVGSPIVVYPDMELMSLAEQKGWELIK